MEIETVRDWTWHSTDTRAMALARTQPTWPLDGHVRATFGQLQAVFGRPTFSRAHDVDFYESGSYTRCRHGELMFQVLLEKRTGSRNLASDVHMLEVQICDSHLHPAPIQYYDDDHKYRPEFIDEPFNWCICGKALATAAIVHILRKAGQQISVTGDLLRFQDDTILKVAQLAAHYLPLHVPDPENAERTVRNFQYEGPEATAARVNAALALASTCRRLHTLLSPAAVAAREKWLDEPSDEDGDFFADNYEAYFYTAYDEEEHQGLQTAYVTDGTWVDRTPTMVPFRASRREPWGERPGFDYTLRSDESRR